MPSSRIAWPAAFPLGVADTDGTLAFCKALDELVVLRLADGAVVWRACMDGHPLIVGQGFAIALCAGEVLAFSIDDADIGALRWRVTLPSTPTEAEAAWIGGDFGVHWQSRERYRGGAHPDLHASTNTKAGQCAIRLTTGSARPLSEWPLRSEPPRWEASDDHSVLSACVLGSTRYRITSGLGKRLDELKLAAIRIADDSVLWERAIGVGYA